MSNRNLNGSQFQQAEIFSGEDFDWQGPKGSKKMPLSIFDNSAQWHGTTWDERVNYDVDEDDDDDLLQAWDETVLSDPSDVPPIHSGTAQAAFDRMGGLKEARFYPMVPLNPRKDPEGALWSDDEVNTLDDAYRRENYLESGEDMFHSKGGMVEEDDVDWDPEDPDVNPLLSGGSAPYSNRVEDKGSTSYASAPEAALLFNDRRRVDRGLGQHLPVRSYATGDEMRSHLGLDMTTNQRMGQRSRTPIGEEDKYKLVSGGRSGEQWRTWKDRQ